MGLGSGLGQGLVDVGFYLRSPLPDRVRDSPTKPEQQTRCLTNPTNRGEDHGSRIVYNRGLKF
jgi:hypothetical protein